MKKKLLTGLATVVLVIGLVGSTMADTINEVRLVLSGELLIDTMAPSVTDFTILSNKTDATVTFTNLTASDNLAVTQWCITETFNSDGCAWSATKPVNYTFFDRPPTPIALYAWAMDASGNVSAGLKATQASYIMGSPVPDTGQTHSYLPGDDGAYVNNPQSYTVNSVGTVTDNVTKLVWQDQDDGQKRTMTDANSYCQSLTRGGFVDWRLPTVNELAVLVNHDQWNPGIDRMFFPYTKGASYWSSIPNAINNYNAWHMDFYDGNAYSDSKDNTYYVRCVRSEPVLGQFGHFVVNNTFSVTDASTGLSWQRQGNATSVNWDNSLTYCNGLNLDGSSNWRLPNINELHSLVDYSKNNPAIDSVIFPNTKNIYFSSTTNAITSSNAMIVYFVSSGSAGGYVNGTSKGNTGAYYARCVNSGPVNETIGALAISSPPQGAKVISGTIQPITWDPANVDGQVAIFFSRDSGKDGSWETIAASTSNDGVYEEWVVTNPISVNCVLKVVPLEAPELVGYNGLFSIVSVPSAPTSVNATAGNTKATVNLAAPSSNGGSSITEYTVTATPGGITASSDTKPITISGLTNGTAYTFTVTASNILGASAVSTVSNIVTPVDPTLQDLDNDGILDDTDNCKDISNSDQVDFDSDGIGDVCDNDADGDGFTVVMGECNDYDPSINPNACDIKSDGIDQDCDGSDRIKGKPCASDGGEEPVATEGKGRTCSDGLDNDGDGFTDCADSDCAKNKLCR